MEWDGVGLGWSSGGGVVFVDSIVVMHHGTTDGACYNAHIFVESV